MAKSKQTIAERVIEYLDSKNGQNHFTAGHLEKAMNAAAHFKTSSIEHRSAEFAEGSKSLESILQDVRNERGKDLTEIVQDFVDTLGPKSTEALTSGNITEFAKSIGRSIISAVKPNEQEKSTYANTKHQEALDNFKLLDKSKFDLDGISLGDAISNSLTEHADILNANDKLKPAMVAVILSTQMLPPKDVEQKAEVITALAAGMIAKTAGKITPFKQALAEKGSLPANVTNAILSASVEIANKSEYSTITPEQAMMFGKEIGKRAKNELSKNANADLKTLQATLTSKCKASKAALFVSQSILDKIARNKERSASETDSMSSGTTRSRSNSGVSI
jgi:hypothetical protein